MPRPALTVQTSLAAHSGPSLHPLSCQHWSAPARDPAVSALPLPQPRLQLQALDLAGPSTLNWRLMWRQGRADAGALLACRLLLHVLGPQWMPHDATRQLMHVYPIQNRNQSRHDQQHDVISDLAAPCCWDAPVARCVCLESQQHLGRPLIHGSARLSRACCRCFVPELQRGRVEHVPSSHHAQSQRDRPDHALTHLHLSWAGCYCCERAAAAAAPGPPQSGPATSAAAESPRQGRAAAAAPQQSASHCCPAVAVHARARRVVAGRRRGCWQAGCPGPALGGWRGCHAAAPPQPLDVLRAEPPLGPATWPPAHTARPDAPGHSAAAPPAAHPPPPRPAGSGKRWRHRDDRHGQCDRSCAHTHPSLGARRS
mmetsp:Transcript_21479/g.47037  ORF Transcript_21479/g.47037 Transcript_21479/m.47037 type:complete len:370 (+) Transcript_21479:1646-2755(+)